MNSMRVVFLKEMRESLRDRRVLLNALLVGPLLGPALFMLILRLAVAREVEQAEQPLPLVVVGAHYAPNLISALEQAGVRILPPITQPEAAVRAQRVELVLVINSSYDADWRAGRTAQVNIIYDSSRREINSQVQRLRGVLMSYSQLQSGMRVIARGLSPTVIHPLTIAERDQATPQARGALLFAMLPYFLVLTAFLGGMFLAIDVTAGERERQSLEPLFINPVARDAILLGKLAAICSFSLTSVVLSLAAFAMAGQFLPTERMAMTVVLDAHFASHALLLMLPLVLLIAMLQTLVTAFANSFREAQTYLSLIQLIPMIPSLLLSVVPFKPQLWMYAIPLLGQQLSIMQLLRGETVSEAQTATCLSATLIAVILLFALVRRLYASERLVIAA